MEAPCLLLEQWTRQVKEIFPQLHGHQQKGLAFAVFSIALTGESVLQRMAEEISLLELSEATMPSIERRLARFVANKRIVVGAVWKLFLAQVLAYFSGKQLSFVLDVTPFQVYSVARVQVNYASQVQVYYAVRSPVNRES